MAQRWAQVVATLVAALTLAACGVAGQVILGGPGSSTSCSGMSSGACSEQADLVIARHPGATDVALVCSLATCDRKGGAGTAVITMGNGAKVNDTFAYTGDPAPIPAPQCIGLLPAKCQELATQQADDVAPSKRIVRIELRCTAVPCTDAKGEVDVKVTFGDGSTLASGVGWEQAGP